VTRRLEAQTPYSAFTSFARGSSFATAWRNMAGFPTSLLEVFSYFGHENGCLVRSATDCGSNEAAITVFTREQPKKGDQDDRRRTAQEA
jgi:hypothetical protein